MKFGKLSIVFLVFMASCISNKEKNEKKQDENNIMNFSHFNYLYKEIKLPNGNEAAIIHIYSNYPDYNYDIEPKEGFTCVDDVARAIVLLSEEKTQVAKIVKMTEFLLYMQNENGWFNNFIWKDLSINTTYKTSVAEPSWWSWRAFWALEKALPILQENNIELAKKVEMAIQKLSAKTKEYLSTLHHFEKKIAGIPVATQLPKESAADQASILTIALTLHYQRTHDDSIKKCLRQLADGMLQMQIKTGKAKGAFLSWNNLWHAYGNTQSYALLRTGKLLNEQKYINAALDEINNFYPFLLQGSFAEYMTFENINNEIVISNEKSYPQIAYGVRPIVFACLEAFQQTGDKKYTMLAKQWMDWFHGKNSMQTVLYNKDTGRCYDGIASEVKINKNSGAESTIEALLSIQKYQSIIKNYEL